MQMADPVADGVHREQVWQIPAASLRTELPVVHMHIPVERVSADLAGPGAAIKDRHPDRRRAFRHPSRFAADRGEEPGPVRLPPR
jgi:hypothetical protein